MPPPWAVMHRETQAVSSTLRLWWRCTLCGWRVDTFGSDQASDVDRTAMGWEVLDHLEAKHCLRIPDARAAAETFEPAGAVRPRKHHVLVARRS